MNDLSDAINNPLTYEGNKAVYGEKRATEALAEDEENQENFLKRNLTQEFQDKTGYSDVVDELEKGSAFRRDSILGQVAQGVGGMVPSLVLGQAMGFNPTMTSTKGLTGAEKIAALAKNIGTTYLSQLPANAMLAAQSYGGGLEEALNEGASRNQARLYGLADAAIEQGTEMMTGGVPGLEGKGGLDQVLEPLIDKAKNPYAKALFKTLYSAAGEGFEEWAADILNPIAKKIYSNEPIDWKQTLQQANQSFITGALTGAVLNGPQTLNNFGEARTENQIRKLDSLNETEKNALTEIALKNRRGEQLSQEDLTTLQFLNQKANSMNNGTVEAATQRVQQVQQALQNGQITQKQANQELQAVNNVLNQTNQTQEVQQELPFEVEEQPTQRYRNLNDTEANRVKEIQQARAEGRQTQQDVEELNYLERKEKGLKYPELTKSDKINKAEMAKYYYNANMDKFDNTLLNKAENIVEGKKGKRTKQQWLDVAENIGTQARNMDAESLKKYAYESFKEARPNQAENLNKQGQKYVGFGIQEWINAVYDGAGVGKQIQQATTQTEIRPSVSQEARTNNLKESAVKYNLDSNSETVKTVQRFMERRGIEATFDDSYFTDNDINAFWMKDKNGNRKVIFNPNATTKAIIEETAVHEMAHDLMSSKNSKNALKAEKLIDYAKTLEGYKEARQNIEEVYSRQYNKNDPNFESLVDEEVVADLLGRKLGNQEFINQLVGEKPSIAKRMYDWIKNKIVNAGKVRNEKAFWQDVKNRFDKAYRMQYENTENKNTKYSAIYNDDGSINRIKINSDIFANNNGKSISKTIKDYLVNNIGDVYTIIESGQKVYLGDDLPNEYVYSEEAKRMPLSKKMAKGQAAQELQEIVENANNRRWEPNRKEKHKVDAKYGFYRYDTSFSFDYNGKERIYDGTILIRNDADGKKYLYDIVNIKPQKKLVNLPSVASNSNKSSAIIDGSSNQSTDNISQNQNNVKPSISNSELQANNELRDRAKTELGTTTNLNEAGYLTNDGEYLDFSGKKQGARGGQRQMDHREVADIYSDEEYTNAEKKNPNMGSSTAILQDFIERGNIRLNGTGVEIATAPTQEQYEKLYDYLEHVQQDNGEVFIDLDTETNDRENLEYNDRTSISKMIKDIKNHYANNEEIIKPSISTKKANVKLSKQKLMNDFQKLTGDSKLLADAKIGRYQVQLAQKEAGNFDGEVQAPYSEEAMKLYNQIENARQTSSHLYHSTPADRIQSIVENGLQIGSKQNQEGVSSENKLYLSATEELARSFTPNDEVTLRVKPSANLENLDYDLLGGEGSYTITNNIEPKYLQVKENGKWVDLLKSEYARNNTSTIAKDNQGRTLSPQQQKHYKNSVMRDENGNLMEVYHGTNDDFTEFDKSYLGSASGDLGFLGDGFYFATHKGEANYYGKKTMPVYLNVTNPYNIQNLQNYNGTDIRGENSNPYVEIKNLVDMNPEWADIKVNYGNTYGDIAKDVNKIAKTIKVEEAGRDASGYRQYKVDVNNKTEFVSTLDDYTKEQVLGDALNKELRDKYGFVNGQDVIQNITSEARMREYNNQKRIKTFSEVLQEQGYDGIIQGDKAANTDEVVVFNPNQIKSVDNLNPTDSNDIRYSWNDGKWEQFLDKNIQREGTGSTLDNIRLPKGVDVATTPKQVSDNFNEAKQGKIGDKKLRSWVNTSNEATNNQNTLSQADKNAITYEVQSNKKTAEMARKNTDGLTYEQKVFRAQNKLNSNQKVTAVDLAEAQMALLEASERGDVKTYLNLQQDIAIMGTELGQAVQAMSMIQRLSPDGQIAMLNKIVDRQQKRGNKNFEGVQMNEELVQKVLDSYDDASHTTFNKEQMDQAVDELKQDIANQMKVSKTEKINAWRYLSMLGNPKTHIRNVVANGAMTVVKRFKDTLAATGQDLFIKDKSQKTTTLKKASKDVMALADVAYNETFNKNQRDSKYNEMTELESKRKIFNNKAIEAVRKFNDAALSAEDQAFKKINFKKSFSKYLTAQGISTSEQINTNPEIIEAAKAFALQEAKVATFNQENKLAQKIIAFDNLNPVARVARGAIIPFARTPLNIAKTGIEYTPGVGLATTYADFKKAPQNMKGAVLIDGISKQVTGSSLALLGYALAKSGILTGSAGDDKEDKFEKDQGAKMDYSIKIGDTSYDLSWLSPSSMPLFVGARMYEILDKQEGLDENVLIESLASTLDPLSELSCISSFTKVLQSYQQGSMQMISEMSKTTAQNYISQFIPTVSSQFARVFDDTKRTTNADRGAGNTFTQETMRQLQYKIPGLRNFLPESTDYFGNDRKENENVLVRAWEAFLSPANTKKDTMTEESKELVRLYKETGNDDVIPRGLQKYINFNNNKYDMSSKEYNQFKKDYGTAFQENLKELMNTNDYRMASDDERAEMIAGIMKYAKDKSKDNYLTKQGEDYSKTTSTGQKSYYESDKVDNLTTGDFGIADYYIYKSKAPKVVTGNMDTVKNKIAMTKVVGIDPEIYNDYLSNVGKIESDYYSNGKSIPYSKQRKTFAYINSLPITAQQKAILFKQKYPSYKAADKQIYNLIQNSDLSVEEKYSLAAFLKFK